MALATIDAFRVAAWLCELASQAVHDVDWLLSGDSGESEFLADAEEWRHALEHPLPPLGTGELEVFGISKTETWLDPMLTSKHNELDMSPAMSARWYHLSQEALLESIDELGSWSNDPGFADFVRSTVKAVIVGHTEMIVTEIRGAATEHSSDSET